MEYTENPLKRVGINLIHINMKKIFFLLLSSCTVFLNTTIAQNKNNLNQLRDDSLWIQAKTENSIRSIHTYMITYPKGKNLQQATEKITTLLDKNKSKLKIPDVPQKNLLLPRIKACKNSIKTKYSRKREIISIYSGTYGYLNFDSIASSNYTSPSGVISIDGQASIFSGNVTITNDSLAPVLYSPLLMIKAKYITNNPEFAKLYVWASGCYPNSWRDSLSSVRFVYNTTLSANCIHVLYGKVHYYGYEFISDYDSPLVFKITPTGYVYLTGKGIILDKVKGSKWEM